MMQNNKCITLVLANYIDLSLTFQIHTDYTVALTRHNNFRKVLGGVRKIYGEQLVNCMFCYSSKCGIHLTRTVLAQWSKSQVSQYAREIESARIQICLHTLLNTANTFITYSIT